MFFGPLLNMSRSYDIVYKNMKTLTSLYHRFVLYYDHFEGGIEACLRLYNLYLAKRMWILEKYAEKKEERTKNIIELI